MSDIAIFRQLAVSTAVNLPAFIDLILART
jgi:hypothetical protein